MDAFNKQSSSCACPLDQQCPLEGWTVHNDSDFETEMMIAREMKDEGRRLMTYSRWPPSSCQLPERLAEAGMYYTGSIDRVKCAFCWGVLKKWQPEDVPFLEHQKHFPYCSFIQGRDVGNIPLRREGNREDLGRSGEDTCPTGDTRGESIIYATPWGRMENCCLLSKLQISFVGETHSLNDSSEVAAQSCLRKHGPANHVSLTEPFTPSSSKTATLPESTTTFEKTTAHSCQFGNNNTKKSTKDSGTSYSCAGIQKDKNSPATTSQQSKHKTSTKDYTCEANRLGTFLHWPEDSKIPPEDLARAGFYHVPTEAKPDRVKCGYCGGKLYGWQDGDDPMVEHARCFPDCPYIKLCVGDNNLSTLQVKEMVPGDQISSNSYEQAPTFRESVTKFEDEKRVDQRQTPSQPEVSEYLDTSANHMDDDVTVGMRSEAVLAVLSMGFPREKVLQIVSEKSMNGKMTFTVDELVDALI